MACDPGAQSARAVARVDCWAKRSAQSARLGPNSTADAKGLLARASMSQSSDSLRAYGPLRLLPLDPRVSVTIERALDYVKRLAALRTDEVKREWEVVRTAFLEAVEASGDAPAVGGVEER